MKSASGPLAPSTTHKVWFAVKVLVDRDDPKIPSVMDIWAGKAGTAEAARAAMRASGSEGRARTLHHADDVVPTGAHRHAPAVDHGGTDQPGA